MSETLTQIFDFISAKWDTVLALFGGATGLIAFLVTFIKIICPLITSKINKKSGVNSSLNFLIKKYGEFEKTVNDLRTEITDSVVDKVVTELDKREEQKQAVYNQILGKTEDIKQEVTQITENVIEQANSKKNEIIETIESKKQELPVIDSNKVNEVVEKIKDDVTKVVIINE